MDRYGIAHDTTLPIAGYKVPRSVEFVEALPMSGAGKILERELHKQHWDGSAHQVS